MSEEELLERKEAKPTEGAGKEESKQEIELKEEKEELEPVEGQKAEVEEKKEEPEGKKEAEERPEEEEVEEVIKKRIVVVDSKEKTLDETISALRKGKYSVIGVETTKEFFEVTEGNSSKEEDSDIKAVTPEEYWELAWGNVPDLLITDLDLKDLDGWEFIFRLKFDNRYYEFREVPIIVRTDEPITIETVKKVQGESIHDYLSKTVKGEELLKKIDKYFETREKLTEKKKEIVKAAGYRVANEYERISLAIRIRLKYLYALKTKLEALKKEGGDPSEIRKIEETFYLQNRELIKYERRKREIKRMLKTKIKVKEDGRRGAETKAESD